MQITTMLKNKYLHAGKIILHTCETNICMRENRFLCAQKQLFSSVVFVVSQL